MAGDKKQLAIWWFFLGVLILAVPVFWHYAAPQNPFLFPKELLVKYSSLVLIGAAIWRYNKVLAIFTLFCIFDSFSRLSVRSQWALGSMRDFLTIFLMICFFVRKRQTKYILWLWLVALIAPLCVAWLQYTGFDPIPRSGALFIGPYWKVAGFFGNTHIFKSWIGLCSPLVFLLPLPFALCAATFLAISLQLFSATIGGLATLLLGCGVTLLCLIRKKTALFLCIFSLCLLIAAFTNAKNHTEIRLEIAKETIPYIQEHPIRGAGLNQFGDLGIRIRETPEAQAHNEYLQAYTEVGIAAFLIPIFIFICILKLKRIVKTKEGAIAAGIFSCFVFNSSFSNPFHYAHSALFFLTILAIIDILAD